MLEKFDDHLYELLLKEEFYYEEIPPDTLIKKVKKISCSWEKMERDRSILVNCQPNPFNK
jgi:hypothetical protein